MPYIVILASSITLFLTSQSFLLTPHRFQILVASQPGHIMLLLGAVLFVISIQGFSLIVSTRSQRLRNFTFLLLAGSLLLLAFLYGGSHPVETGILIVLSTLLLLATWFPYRFNPSPSSLLNQVVAGLNIIIGFVSLFWPGFIFSGDHIKALEWKLVLESLFLATGVTGILILISPVDQFRRITSKLLALPWVLWSAIFIINLGAPEIVPSLSLAIALVFDDRKFWQGIAIPSEQILGRRLLQMVAVALGVLLAVVTLLLLLSDVIFPDTPAIIADVQILRDIALIFFLAVSLVSAYTVITICLTFNDLDFGPEFRSANKLVTPLTPVAKFLTSLVAPFSAAQNQLRHLLNDKVSLLDQQAENLRLEKKKSFQLSVLVELSQQLSSTLDQPVSAQLAVNAIQRAFDCSLVTLFNYDAERREFVSLANAGFYSYTIPPGYRQSEKKGILGRAARLRKTQVVTDTAAEPEYIGLDSQTFRSEMVVPLIHNGRLRGAIAADDDKPGVFNNSDATILESFGTLVIDAWEQGNYNQRLSNLIQAGINISTLMETQDAIRQLAAITREALEARFVFVTLLDQDGSFSRTAHSGFAADLIKVLSENITHNELILNVLNSQRPIRVRDIRKYPPAYNLPDLPNLRTMLAFPIRLHRMSIGAVLAFGKQSGLFFEEADEALTNLIASPAAAAIESSWLYQELRNALNTATLLFQLSTRVIQAERISEAATAIAETTFKLGKASLAGIVLFSPEGEIATQVEVDANGPTPGFKHPIPQINQVMETGQSLMISEGVMESMICLPMHTHLRKYGVLWLDIPESRWYNSRYAANLQTLANQAAIALERSILLVETRRQASQIEQAYDELSLTYDQTLVALMSALDARDKETEGHSNRVGKLASSLGKKLGLTPQQLKSLERGAILHDIGKIGISDTILHKPGPLSEDEWRIMRAHPYIGARIIEGIPFLEEAHPIVRFHHERWNGSGYPMGLKGVEIPLSARIFAVADAFDALISDRPYRRRVSVEEAINYLQEQAGVLFDPEIVRIYVDLIEQGEVSDLLALA